MSEWAPNLGEITMSVPLAGRIQDLPVSPNNDQLSGDIATEASSATCRTVVHPLGRVILAGDSFVGNHDLQEATDRALRSGDYRPLTEFHGGYATLVQKPNELAVFASAAGAPSIYYGARDGRAIVSTQPLAVAGPSLIEIDSTVLGLQLLGPSYQQKGLLQGRSGIEGVSRLNGGQALRVTPQGIESYTYDPLTPNIDMTLEEGAAGLRQALQDAINVRLEMGLPLTGDLSGGVDSGSIIFSLLQRLGSRRLPVFFAGEANAGQGDIEYVRQFAALDSRLELEQFDTATIDKAFTYDQFSDAPRPADPLLAQGSQLYNIDFVRHYFGHINTAAGGLHLTGHGGDEVAAAGPAYLADLFRAGRLSDFARETGAWARLGNISPLVLAGRAARLALAPQRNMLSTARLLAGGNGHFDPQAADEMLTWRQPLGPGIDWLTPGMRRNLAAYLGQQAEGFSLPEHTGLADMIALEGLWTANRTIEATKHYTKIFGYGFSPQAPFLDSRVVRAAFAVPAGLRANPYAYKAILQRAMQGLVPDQVLRRQSKGSYNETAFDAFDRSLPALQKILNNSYLGDIGLIDPAKIRSLLPTLYAMPMHTMWALEQVLGLEGWLRTMDTSRRPDNQGLAAQREVLRLAASAASSEVNSPPAQITLQEDAPAYGVPEHVYAVASDKGQLILYNRMTRLHHPLDGPQSDILRLLDETGSPTATVDSLRRQFPAVDPAVMQRDVAKCVRLFVGKDLLVAANLPRRNLPVAPRAFRFRSQEYVVARRHGNKQSLKDRLATAGALLIGEVILGRFAPSARLPALWRLQKLAARREASAEEAHRLLAAAQSLPSLGRLACREPAYAAALAAALQGKKVAYHQGASLCPFALHAWIEVRGSSIVTGLEGHVTGNFQSFFSSAG